jgi:hypothetical protein
MRRLLGKASALRLGVLVCMLAAYGCAAVTPALEPPAARPAAQSADAFWWYLRFRMDWPEGKPPAWHMDLLLADQVVRPVLERRRADLSLWRFHRRAARDAAGHQFSFIFYATPETARNVFEEVDASAVLGSALAAGRVAAVLQDDPMNPSRPGRGDTGDPAWSAALRTAWPDYLMGASRMWLSLVSQMAASPPPAASGFVQMEDVYARANASVAAVWREEGRHAFLHHLNALFGYEPLLMRF